MDTDRKGQKYKQRYTETINKAYPAHKNNDD